MTWPLPPYWCDYPAMADLARVLHARAAKGGADAETLACLDAVQLLFGAVACGGEIPPLPARRREMQAAIAEAMARAKPGSDAHACLTEMHRQLAPWDETASPLTPTSLIERNHRLTLQLRAQAQTERIAA